MDIKGLRHWIKEREAIRLKRATGKPPPWTQDEILMKYRFCNVHREDDKVTIYVRDYWRDALEGHPDLWFWMSVCRWVNWPDTLQEYAESIGLFELPDQAFKPGPFVKVLKARAERGDKVWTGAYMIGTQGNAMDKPRFIAEQVLFPLWKCRDALRPRVGDTLASFAERVVSVKNQGKFMVAQMVADAKYCQRYLTDSVDWSTFALSGPGSRRGMNRIVGRETDKAWKEAEWHENLMQLRYDLNLDPKFHNQDLQNCLCEFDKYERVRLGEGRPRSTFNGMG